MRAAALADVSANTWSGHITRASGRISGVLADADGLMLDLTAVRRTARHEAECFGLWLRGDLSRKGSPDGAFHAALAETRVITGQIDRVGDGLWMGSLGLGPHTLAITGHALDAHRIGLRAALLPPKHQVWFETRVEHLHTLGPRALAELLREIAAKLGGAVVVEEMLEHVGRISPAMIEAARANRFHRPTPREVPPELMKRAA